MASVGKKLGLNFAKGRTALKSNFPIRKTGHTRDELDVEGGFGGKRKTSHDCLSGNISVGTPLYKGPKSTSMGSVHSDSHEGPMDHDQIVQLTHYVRSLSEGLALLKAVFTDGDKGGVTAEELRVAAHDKLGDVLGILKEILQKYPSLHTTDVLTTAAMLITKIKSSYYEEVSQDAGNLLYMIDQLALAFSTSVSDYLMGDIDNFPTIGKTKSYDNLASESALDDQTMSTDKGGRETDDEVDAVLQRLGAHSGVDRALQQAKLWSKYVKEIITYVEKKNALENEYSKNLTKLANNLKNSIMKETFLPMQAIFCTSFDQDMDFSAASQTTCTIIQTQKFVEPLNSRRAEHEKSRKHLKDLWTKELKRMQESVSNLHKARANYVQRQQDHEKARESTQKTELENLSNSTAGQITKLEKKRKLEEEAVYKSLEAETTYKACVAEANHRQKELDKVKCRVLAEVRDLIYHSDEIMKQVTVAYFQLLHALSAPKPVQFQALCETSGQYDPGSQYVEYVRRIHVPSDLISTPEPFVFEHYTPEAKSQDGRRPNDDTSPFKDGKQTTLKVHGEEDTDSISDSSSRSQESSPTASPYQGHRHTALANSMSLGKLGDTDRTDPRLVSERARMTFRGVELSPAARTHLFKKLRTLSKCRQCESYVYFQGAECEQCGLSTHKKCLETLHWECGHQAVQRRMTTFGVDFSEHVQETHMDIPRLVWNCTEEIDDRGLDIKGIYRVSGVKSKVESLCQEFEMDESNVDLSEHHPNVIANVLKLYLRQLPEPLVSFRLYPEFIRLAKEEQLAGGGQGPASPDIIHKMSSLVKRLSKAQFKTCGHLMHHLHRVTAAQETNQMNAYNIGVVFGPTLLRQSEDAVSLDSLLDTPCQTRIVELMIHNVLVIFGPEDQFQPLLDKEPVSKTTPLPSTNNLPGSKSPGILLASPDSPITNTQFTDANKSVNDAGKPTVRTVPEITRDLIGSEVKMGVSQSPPVVPQSPSISPQSPVLTPQSPPTLPQSPLAPPPLSQSPLAPPMLPQSPLSTSMLPQSPLAPPPLSQSPLAPPTMPQSPLAPPTMPQNPLSTPTLPQNPPTLLEMSAKSSKSDGAGSSSPTPSSSTSVQGFIIPEAMKDEADGSVCSSSSPSTQSVSTTSPCHPQLYGPSLSAGAILDVTTSPISNSPGSHKKILTSQVISRCSPRSRDSSPSDNISLPPLSRPQPFTPPSHRRLCRTGTGGLLERPCTPDPLPEESDTDSQEDSIEAYTRHRRHRPYQLVFEQSLSKSQSVPNLIDEATDDTALSKSIFYRDTPVLSPVLSPVTAQSPIDLTHSVGNNNSLSSGQAKYPVLSPGARSTFYTPLPRMGRRHSLEPASLAMSSPSIGRHLVPKDQSRLPKYV